MRIAVMSDSHGNLRNLEKVIVKNYGADFFIFLGDCVRDLDLIKNKYPNRFFYSVKGNNDFACDSPQSLVMNAGMAKIYACHGHNAQVYYDPAQRLYKTAKQNGCNVALFGHTHCRYSFYLDGVHILNPGSVGFPRDGLKPSFGYIDVTDAGIVTNIVDL